MGKVSDEAIPSAGRDGFQGPILDHRDKVSILVIGRPTAVNRVILEMSHLGFSDSIEWSKSGFYHRFGQLWPFTE